MSELPASDEGIEILSPTEEAYGSFYEAYRIFNTALFEDDLPDCLITMQRSKRSYGYFAGERFRHRRGSEIVDEIALNPRTFIDRTDREIVSTLVHEMVHSGNSTSASPGGGVITIGPMPSHSGKPGGKRIGQSMTHYILDGGSYDTHWQLLTEAGFTLDYQDRYVLRPAEPKKVKVHYACPVCSIHVWGKPKLRLRCEGCDERLR